jgi:hypothetical protein
MPEIRADLFCRVDAFGSDPLSLRVQVQNDVADPDGLRIDAAIDGTAGAMAVPTSIARQKINMRVYVDGSLVPELHACRVTRSRKQNLQTWEITLPIHSGTVGYAGDWTGNGVTLCKKRIDIYGVYQTSTGTHEIPLISNGITDNEGRESNGGALVTYTGVDRGGRYDKEVADFILPPGSGLPRDRVVEIAARRCGVEDISLEHSDAVMLHEFQMADAPFLGPCQELADVEGRVIQWDRSGDMIWRRYGSGALVPSSSRWSFTERNFVAGSCKLSQPGELITEITVEGDLQEIVGPCGDTTSRVTITTTSINGPTSPLYQQNSGAYTVNPQPAALDAPITIKVETFDKTTRCGILVFERRTVYEWFNPEASRYEWNAATDSWDRIANVYTDDNTDDDSPAYLYSRQAWLKTEVDETWHYWMREGFEGQTLIPLCSRLDMGYGLRAPKGWDGTTGGNGYIPANESTHSYARGIEGCKIGTRTVSKRRYGIRQYVKSRLVTSYPYDIWEEVEPANGWKVLGGKESIVGDSEQLFTTEQVVNILGTDGNGYQTDDDVYRFQYFVRKGSDYLYGDDTERAESAESLQFTGATYTKFIGTGKTSHDEIVTETNQDDRTVSTVATTGLESYMPAAERIPDSGPTTDTDVYTDDTEQTELYQKAYLTESKPISVTVTDDALEHCSTRGVHKVHSNYLESEDEADWLARWLLDEGAAGVFDGELAGANFFVEPGDWCSLIRYRQIGLAGCSGRIEEISWDWRAGEPMNTKIQALLYP